MHRVIAGIAVVLALGCGPRTEGSGVAGTEARRVAAFSEVSASSGVDVVVRVGGALSVAVAGDDNLVPLVETEVSGNRLRVGFKSGQSIHMKLPLHVDVAMPALSYLGGSSGSHVQASGVAAGGFELEASSGAVVDAGELAARSAAIHASSGAKVVVRAAEAVRGEASSGASVRVLGNPATRSVSTSSGADVSYP